MKTLIRQNPCGLLPEVPEWVIKGMMRRIRRAGNKLLLISAVCPDYERVNGKFTYHGLGEGLPFITEKHLGVAEVIRGGCEAEGIGFEFRVTLADTEFDLPLVIKHLTSGDEREFLRRCESSAKVIEIEALGRNLPIKSSERFISAFPEWFTLYEKALAHVKEEVLNASSGSSVRTSLEYEATSRVPLYRAMAGQEIAREYCREMVLRQWAQYMTWGECATEKFGDSFVMMNHDTPNLARVNSPFFRQGRERIPFLKLDLSTVPE